MNTPYQFEDAFVAFSDEKVHLLRNRFEYDAIPFSKLESIILTKGRTIKNWLIILMIGIGLLSAGGYAAFNIYDFFTSSEGGRIFIEEIMVVFIVNIAGLYCTYIALAKETVLQINTRNQVENFSIKSFKKSGVFEDLMKFLEQKVTIKQML